MNYDALCFVDMSFRQKPKLKSGMVADFDQIYDEAIKECRDPDEARRARGEAYFLTSRALKLAPDNEEVKRLRYGVVKLLGLKAN